MIAVAVVWAVGVVAFFAACLWAYFAEGVLDDPTPLFLVVAAVCALAWPIYVVYWVGGTMTDRKWLWREFYTINRRTWPNMRATTAACDAFKLAVKCWRCRP